jgi:hypothetical protein
MAAFHGKQGRVTFAAGAVSNVLSWSINATADTADGTVMSAVTVTAATHWKSHLVGFKDWTATIECDLDSGGLDPDLDTDFSDADGIAVVLYEGLQSQSVRKYSGNGIITAIRPSTDKNDVAKVTYEVQGSGELSVAASDYAP